MSNRSSNRAAVPEAKSALDRFKYEVAGEIGVPLNKRTDKSRSKGICNCAFYALRS